MRPGDQTLTRLKWWVLAERVAWTLGLATLTIWGGVRVAGVMGARQELHRFEAARQAAWKQPDSVTLSATSAPDVSLWDTERVKAWETSLRQPASAPLAVLRIPKIGLEVAVLPGTDEFALNRGVGHIEDTAMPGSDGNSGIAGHRDGFFRGLKGVLVGDEIELETLHGREQYRIERIWIVKPDDVSVLDPTPNRTLTLVTCYPFYFMGSAPQRYIVRAVRVGATDQIATR